MSKIYISGQITGLKLEESKANFDAAFDMLALYWPHADIVNPFDIKPFLGIKKWLFYMITDVLQLRKCNTIYMLKSWEKSRGACIEHLIALSYKKTIIYQ